MDTTEPNWDLWRAFAAVMDVGTLSGAARRLALTQPTIGRQIEALEQALGYPLFVRSQQGLAPTEAARALAPLAATMAATADALARAGVGEGGVVRLTASDVVACEVLPPMLASFRAKHPDIEIELSASNLFEDLLTREADLAVRMARPTQQALIAKKIGVVAIRLYAHADYLKRAGTPQTLDDLYDHTLIGYDRERALLDFLHGAGIDVARNQFALRTDSDVAQVALLRAGAGIGGLQEPLARRTPKLKPVLHEAISIPLEIWLVQHEDLRRARHVRLLFEHLERGLKAYLSA